LLFPFLAPRAEPKAAARLIEGPHRESTPAWFISNYFAAALFIPALRAGSRVLANYCVEDSSPADNWFCQLPGMIGLE
jgi:hypothetical protein